MTSEYKKRFTSKDAAAEYVNVYADERSYANLLYSIEKNALSAIMRDINLVPAKDRYLDFAVGTGRIITHLEDQFRESEGVDISEDMIAVSRQRVKGSTLRCSDITAEEMPREPYDVITAFRFFLNAEPDLRQAIMSALTPRLRPGTGSLVVNNHGRILSVKALSWLITALTSALFGRKPKQVFMSDAAFSALVKANGLKVVHEIGYGVLGGRIGHLLGYSWSERIEKAAAGKFFGNLLGTSRIYVLKQAHSN